MIENDVVQNIKSEMFIDEDNNDSKNTLLKNYLNTLHGMKSDQNEATIIETHIDVSPSIKNENDSDEIYSDDEITVKELSDKTIVKLLAEVKKGSTDLKKNQKDKIENQDVNSEKNEEECKMLVASKDNYFKIDMTEEEMLAARELARQADRYKNKVKYRCQLCIVGFFNKDLYEKHMRSRHSEVNLHCN